MNNVQAPAWLSLLYFNSFFISLSLRLHLFLLFHFFRSPHQLGIGKVFSLHYSLKGIKSAIAEKKSPRDGEKLNHKLARTLFCTICDSKLADAWESQKHKSSDEVSLAPSNLIINYQRTSFTARMAIHHAVCMKWTVFYRLLHLAITRSAESRAKPRGSRSSRPGEGA
jgi:hypothetical protein